MNDDQSARETLSKLLDREGYAVRCALSGQTALMLAREELPEQNIKPHRAHLMKKMGVDSLADLVHAAERLGIGK